MRKMSTEGKRRRGFWSAAIALVVLLALGGAAQATHLSSDVAGHTTLERAITGPDPAGGYANLSGQDVNGSHIVRDGAGEGAPDAQSGRQARRASLAYFGQFSDFQIADEESPARVEFLDPEPSGFAASAWRPQEALLPVLADSAIRQMNRFAPASPVTQGDGSRAAMDFTVLTGDLADSQQRNETRWVRELLEGGTVNPNSGSANPADWDPLEHPSCALYPPTAANLAEAARYTGVQDYDDYDEGPSPYFYDPDDVRGFWATNGWPSYPGLMDRAQAPFSAAGVDVPSYVATGNHDALVQGNEDANSGFEALGTGCLKVLAASQQPAFPGLDPSVLLSPPAASMPVPPDPMRRFVDKRQRKAEYATTATDNAHGLDFVDAAENAASSGSASYYAWDPPQAPGFRFISMDSVSEGGVVEQSANGNIDDPQFRWLENELEYAQGNDKLVVVFSHHPVSSLSSNAPDEAAGACSGLTHGHGDTPEHDQVVGCDIDPRLSTPIHKGLPSQRQTGETAETVSELFNRFPNVIAHVAGHTHENRVTPFARPGGGPWWSIETAAEADWSVQTRLLEVMDNRDGTLSIFGTVLDAAAPSEAPDPGPAATFDAETLASIGRELTYNDPQAGLGSGEGAADDRNVELLVKDPRRANLALTKSDSPDPVGAGETLTYTLEVRNFGPSGASGVTVTDMLPASVSYDSATSSQGTCMQAAGTVTCDLGYVPNGATVTVTIAVTPTSPGTIVNQASVSGDQQDVTPQNNADTENTTVQPFSGYPRPQSASPLILPLVPAYAACAAPNRTHGPPLTHPSCSPPAPASASLTFGTADSNGRPTKGEGLMRIRVISGAPSAPPDEADVAFTLDITDVRRQSDLADYTGEVQGQANVRITDRWNGTSAGGGSHAATVVDVPFPFPAQCAATADPTIGGRCNVSTSLDAVVGNPGTVLEGKRAVWQFNQVSVIDGGPDGDTGTSPNTVFLRQGIFVP